MTSYKNIAFCPLLKFNSPFIHAKKSLMTMSSLFTFILISLDSKLNVLCYIHYIYIIYLIINNLYYNKLI